jgi:transposase
MSSPYQLIGYATVTARDGGHHGADEFSRAWEALLEELDHDPPGEGWVTLAEAAAATGLSRSTLRSWYRRGEVPSTMVAGRHGPQRLVRLDAVVERTLQSPRGRRQLEHARSLDAEVASLRRRVDALERHLGLS